jgi:hypothetical protein
MEVGHIALIAAFVLSLTFVPARTSPAIARRRSTPDESWFEEVRTGLFPGDSNERVDRNIRRLFAAAVLVEKFQIPQKPKLHGS